MRMSERGLAKLKEWEGCILHVYKDAAGLPTIGVGHLIHHNEDYSKGLTEEQALDLLASDLIRFEAVVNNEVKVPLSQSQFDTLVSFTFNVGCQAFRDSTLLKKLNAGDYDAVPNQLMRWTKAGGKQCNGLIARRENECKLWESVA